MTKIQDEEQQLLFWLGNTSPMSSKYPRWYEAWFKRRDQLARDGACTFVPPAQKISLDWRGPEVKPIPETCDSCGAEGTDQSFNSVWIGSGMYPKEVSKQFKKQLVWLCKPCLKIVIEGGEHETNG